VLAGPIAWMLQLLAGYPVAQEHCHSAASAHASLALAAVTVGALILIALGTKAGQASFPQSATQPPLSDPAARAKFMARLGLSTAAMFSLLVIATAVALMLNGCD